MYAIVQVGLVSATSARLGKFNPFWHGLVPVLAVAAIVYLFVKNIAPQPAYPSSLAIWISVGWAVLGLLIVAILVQLRPDRLASAAAIIGDTDAAAEAGLRGG